MRYVASLAQWQVSKQRASAPVLSDIDCICYEGKKNPKTGDAERAGTGKQTSYS